MSKIFLTKKPFLNKNLRNFIDFDRERGLRSFRTLLNCPDALIAQDRSLATQRVEYSPLPEFAHVLDSDRGVGFCKIRGFFAN